MTAWDQIKESLEQVEYLQQRVLDEAYEAATTDDAQFVVEYHHLCYALFDKQHNLWTRLALMAREEGEARQMAVSLAGIMISIETLCDSMGKPQTQTVSDFHIEMKEEAKLTIGELTNQDLDDYDGIDVDFRWK